MIEQHGHREDRRDRVGDPPLPAMSRRRAVDRFRTCSVPSAPGSGSPTPPAPSPPPPLGTAPRSVMDITRTYSWFAITSKRSGYTTMHAASVDMLIVALDLRIIAGRLVEGAHPEVVSEGPARLVLATRVT